MYLRNFLYLDSPTLNNYLSGIEGYEEVEVEETTTQQKQGGGKINVKMVEGSTGVANSTSRKRKLATTDEAKFQRLFELINTESEVLHLDAFDQGIWNTLQRNEIIEVQANLAVPPIVEQTQAVKALDPLMELFKLVGTPITNDQKTDTAIKGMASLGNIIEQKPLPVLFEAVSTEGFRFYTGLTREHLRCDLNQLLQGEVTVFGKILRILDKGKSEVVFDIFQDFSRLIGANRQQKRGMQKKQKDLRHKLKGPAIILATTAIYQ